MFKVMIVDDEWIVREGLKTTIPWHEMQCEVVAEAGNGLEALRLAGETNPDIVLSDIRMPGMNGLDLVRKLRQLDEEVRTILLTGFDEFTYAQQALKLGAFDLLLKPSDPEELRRTIGAATREITLNRQRTDYVSSLERHRQGNHPFVVATVLRSLLTDSATLHDMSLLYDGLEGRVEPFEAFRVALLDVASAERGETATLAGFCLTFAITEPIPMPDGATVLLLYEADGRRWPTERDGQGTTVSLSRTHRGLLELGRAYDEARIARLHHPFRGDGPVLLFEDLSERELSPPGWNEAEIVEAIKWGSEEKMKETLQTLYRSLLWTSGGREAAPGPFGAQLAFGVHHLLSRHFRETGGMPDLRRLLEEIKEHTTGAQLLAWLEGWIRDVQLRYLAVPVREKDAFDQILDYVSEHYNEELMLYDLAERLHMSESQFSKLFKKRAGKSFMDYVTELRINKAKELLLDSGLRIGEIALTVGYRETRYFSQLFKKTTGMTQNDFRQQMQRRRSGDRREPPEVRR